MADAPASQPSGPDRAGPDRRGPDRAGPATARDLIAASWTESGLRGLLRLATVDQWAALRSEHRELPPPTPADELRVLGVFAVVAAVLLFNEYGVEEVLDQVHVEGRRSHRDAFEYCGWALLVGSAYLAGPLIYGRFVLGLRPIDLGLRLRGLREHAWLYGAMLAAVSPLVVFASTQPHFLRTYPFFRRVETLPQLLVWESSYAFQFVGLELFFRGFMLFGTFRVLGSWSIPAMCLPYLMIHFGKPLPEAMGSIVAGMVLGTVALRTRSVFAGMFVHVAVAWSMDLLSLGASGRLARIFGE